MPRKALYDLGIGVGLAATAIVAWYLRLILPAKDPPGILFTGDLFLQSYPMALRGADWIRAGELPLWNPYQFAGHPFLATGLYGLLYPPNVVFLVLPPALAIEASAVLRLAAAGVFT